jgi:hypothetical protein
MANQLIKLLTILVISVAGLTIPAGCASTDELMTARKRTDDPARRQEYSKSQIIIKFNNNNINPLGPGFIEGLSRDAGAKILYLRPMSGDAHVFSVNMTNVDSSIDTIIRKLSERMDVTYVESNSIMKHQ